MFNRVLLGTAILLVQVTNAAQVNLETRVVQQVERIRTISGSSENLFMELPATSHRGGPVAELISYGMDAVPYLTPYLADTSLSQAYKVHGSGRKRQAAVYEYIIHVINKISDHNFSASFTQDGLPDSKALQRQVLSWWRENRSKSLLERKLDDVNDQDHSNRFSAYEWLGRARATEGRLALERRIETLLTGSVDSLKQSEMATCAESLAKIGDRDSTPVVRQVCDHLNHWFGMSYKPIEEGRSAKWSGQITELFKAYHALALLGFRDEALAKLKELESKYFKEMESPDQREFLRTLAKTEQW